MTIKNGMWWRDKNVELIGLVRARKPLSSLRPYGISLLDAMRALTRFGTGVLASNGSYAAALAPEFQPRFGKKPYYGRTGRDAYWPAFCLASGVKPEEVEGLTFSEALAVLDSRTDEPDTWSDPPLYK